jgi:drug/metabolite transporter (DMT)-like permease
MAVQANPRLGILLFLASVGFITVVDTTAKSLTEAFHALQIVWGYFFGISLYVALYALVAARRTSLLRTTRPWLQVVRSALLVFSITSLFVGLAYLPIAEATVIGFTAPLFVVALSGPLLGERVGPHRWLAVLLGLAGVLVIVRPGGGIAHWAAAMPLLGAAAFALYQIATRVLVRTETTATTLLYTAFGGLIWTSLLVPFVWVWPAPAHWLAFLFIGALGAAAHLCLIKAFEMAQASLLAPLNYSKLIWATLAGFLVFGDLPGLNTAAGCALIVAGGLHVILRERRAWR